jgi:preprotein translocase subunit SecE
MNTFLAFLREVRVELNHVSWPTRRELLQYTGVVLGLCAFFAIFLGGLDSLFAFVLRTFITG